jgi:group I intron endonuclease
MVGIYKITNPEGKAYIGYSKKVENRWASHKNTQHKANYKLKESLTKYGGDSHQFEIIEEVDISLLSRGQGDALLRKRERYWIKTLDTFYNGLNSNGGGSGCSSHTAESKRLIGEANSKPKPKDFGKNRKKWQHTEEYKAKMRNAARKPIIVISLDGKITKEFNTQVQAATWIGVSPNILQLILRKKPQSNGKIPTTTKGFKISYK